jgi:hypothetical protein
MPINATSFRKTLTYAATEAVAQIFQDLDEIVKIEKKIKSQQYLTLIVVLISGTAVYASSVLIRTNPSLGGILLLSSSVALILGGILFVKFSPLNIPSYRYDLIKALLSLVSRDSKENATFNIHLVFSSPTAKNKQISSGNHPNRRGWKFQLFQNRWCNLEGELLDGNRFQLTISEFYRIASGWNRRGTRWTYKNKTKSKGAEIILKVNSSPRQYGAVKVLREEAKGAIKLPPGVEIKGLKMTDNAILLNVKVPSDSDAKSQEALYKIITMMFLSLYQILNLAKMLTKKKND